MLFLGMDDDRYGSQSTESCHHKAYMFAYWLLVPTILVSASAAHSKEPVTKLVCAGPLCARLQLIPQSGMGAQLIGSPGDFVNMRCGNRQEDSRTSTRMYCRDRAISLQHCKKGWLKSSCSPWFVFPMRSAHYNPSWKRSVPAKAVHCLGSCPGGVYAAPYPVLA